MSEPTTAAAHNLEHGSDVIKVTTPATAALSARSLPDVDLADVAAATVTGHDSGHWFGPRSASSFGSGHPVMFGKPQPSRHFDAMPDGGGYPKGFVEWALNIMGCDDADEVLHICSGSMRTGVRVDVRHEMSPTVVADGRALPFRDGTFRFVMIDPPYAEDYARNLYGTAERYPAPGALMNEACRVLAPGGKVGLLHFVVPMTRRPLRIRGVYGVTTGSGYAIRAWTLCEREPESGQLDLLGEAS